MKFTIDLNFDINTLTNNIFKFCNCILTKRGHVKGTFILAYILRALG